VRKDRERAILEMIYDVDQFDSVRNSESPDFTLQHRSEQEYFGVEITEFYLTDSDARIRSLPGYMTSLFAGGQVRHKDDIDALKVGKATLTRADGSGEEIIDVISRKLPGVSTYAQMVAAAIERKDQKMATYKRGLSHVSLIVLDQGKRLITASPEHFYSLFFNSELRNVLARTEFREIFFVTVLRDTKRVYIPLKSLFLLSEFYMFYWALDQYEGDKKYDSIRTEVELFVEFMRRRSVSIDILERADEGIELLWGNSGILVNASGITVRNYADYALPRGIDTSHIRARDSLLEPSFFTFWEDFTEQNTFVSDMTVEVLQDARV
jgi:hypothetical protein